MDLEKKVEVLKKKTAELEVQVPEQTESDVKLTIFKKTENAIFEILKSNHTTYSDFNRMTRNLRRRYEDSTIL